MNTSLLANELVAPGGPSAPVWTFLIALTTGVLAIIGQQISSRRAANEAKIEAAKAAANSLQAKENTTNISNGFVGRMDRKLDSIGTQITNLDTAFREHLEWHLDKETSK